MIISNNEKRIYSFISEYNRDFGKSPTLREIQSFCGFKSLTSVQRVVKSLKEKNYIEINKHQQRGIKIKKSTKTISIPLIGAVACGAPMLAVENIEGHIPTEVGFITNNPKDYFYLRAHGDSMNKAGIDDGDLVLIHSQSHANEGDRVVALLDDSATIKIFKKRDGFVILEPKSYNSSHHPIILKDDFLIQGVVSTVVKS